MLFQVEVKRHGNRVTEHVVEAPDALSAINLVELLYGEPPSVEYVMVEDEEGRKRSMMVVNNWHGYSFHARAAPR